MKQFRSQIILTVIVGCFLVVPQVVSANILDSIRETAQGFVFTVLTQILGFFVWLAALLLNFSINTFVIGFGDTYAKSGVGVAVENTWIIVRDFVNLAFIFGFVYIGFKMILNASDSNTRRWLVNIIIAALLVNFSLFMVKFAIDISNQLASQIAVSSFVTKVNSNNNLLEVDVAQAFMDRMGLTTILRQPPQGAGWGYIFGSAMLFLTAMFVFAAGGILLIIRFAVLNLFMVLSPLMFLGFILPPLKDTFERFWKMFLGRAFFAPIYLLFIYFSLQIISGLQVSVGGNDNGNGFANPDWGGTFQQITPEGAHSGLTLGTFPFFVLICIFLGMSVVVANKLGADGGSKAVSLGKAFGNRIRKTVSDNTGGVAMRAVNRGSAALQSRYEQMDATLSKTRGGRLTRGLLTAASLGALSDRSVKATFKAGANARFDGSRTADEVDKEKQERQKLQNKTNEESKRAQDFTFNETAINEGIGSTTDREDASNKLAATIKSMSDDEIKGLSKDQLQSETVAKHLSDAQIKMLKESGLYANEDIAKIKEARDTATFSTTDKVLADVNATADQLNDTFEELGKTIKSFSEERLQNIKFDRLASEPFASHLSNAQVESLEKSGKFTSQQMSQIKDARAKGIEGRIDGTILPKNTNALQETFRQRQREQILSGSIQDIGKLPTKVFMNSEIARYLTPAMLEQRMRNGGIKNEELDGIRTNIETHVNELADEKKPGAEQAKKMWTQWTDRSTYGAQLNLNFKTNTNTNNADQSPARQQAESEWARVTQPKE